MCLHLINEAQLAGWRAIPEYPKSRFDIFLVAEKWVTTAGAEPGTQVGVQAKMGFNKELVHQLNNHLRRQRRWNNPEYIVGLVPQIPSTAAARQKQAELKVLGIGLFDAYSTFAGNEHPDTKAAENFKDISKFGKKHDFYGRVPVPPEDYPFVLPGNVGGAHWSDWKEKAINFLVAVTARGGELFLSTFAEFGINQTIWIRKGWVTRTGRKVGRKDVYHLNPECLEGRPDIVHPYEFQRRLEAYGK